MINKNEEYNSDEDVNVKEHSHLLEEILQLDKQQYVKKSTRTEPAAHVSEFNLVKSSRGPTNKIKVKDLTKTINKQRSKYNDIVKKVTSTQQKVNTLRKPLEKPQAERIRRSIGFEKTQTELNKWNSIVEKNRVAAKLTFPLEQDTVEFIDAKSKKDKQSSFELRTKSELDKELEKLDPVVEVDMEIVESPFPLSAEELLEQRQEMARLRARQSYQEAKAHKRNKIKSKTFHRIERKERLRKQIKEFEELKKTDPEEALRKLEQLEKTRAEERISLRHRSTGQWAKSKLVRAKYDKESRQAISQQLVLSRELSQKVTAHDSSDESGIEDNIPLDNTLTLPEDNDNNNPWIQPKIDDLFSGYRKFWIDNNAKKSMTTKSNEKDDVEKNKSFVKKRALQNKAQNGKICIGNEYELDELKTENKKLESISFCGNSWIVSDLLQQSQVEDLFEDLNDIARIKVEQKIKQIKASNNNKRLKSKCISATKPNVTKTFDVSLPREKLRPEIDEEIGIDFNSQSKPNLNNVNEILIPKVSIDQEPAKFVRSKPIKPVNLDSYLPDIALAGDNSSDEEHDEQRAVISEAFEDDNILEEFCTEKTKVIEDDKPKDVDLSMPGWGTWGGKNIKLSARKKRRFIVETPKKMPRRDDNKGHLIINEHKDAKVRQHQVSEMPFPFKSVDDFEASIRAPIGNTFVPQTAFQKLTEPSLVTKKGSIIEPMSENILLNSKFVPIRN